MKLVAQGVEERSSWLQHEPILGAIDMQGDTSIDYLPGFHLCPPRHMANSARVCRYRTLWAREMTPSRCPFSEHTISHAIMNKV
jgi:hypothetical protein